MDKKTEIEVLIDSAQKLRQLSKTLDEQMKKLLECSRKFNEFLKNNS